MLKLKLKRLLLRLFDKLIGYCVHGHRYGTGCDFCEHEGYYWMGDKK